MKYDVLKPAMLCLLAVFLYACSKDEETPPVTYPPLTMPDTISAGWTKTILKQSSQFYDVVFQNSDTGYLAGLYEFYKSVNGGMSWDSLSADGFHNIFVTNNGYVFGVKEDGSVSRSVDGGHSFTNTHLSSSALTDIFFTGPDSGYIVSRSGECFTTFTKGNSWQKAGTMPNTANNGFASLFMVNNSSGWANNDNRIYRTNGSPASWTMCNMQPIVNMNVGYSFYAVSSSKVFAGCSDGQLLRSIDGGQNFTLVRSFPGSGYLDLQFLNENLGYACFGNRVYKTIDGGINWEAVVSLGNDVLIEIHFTDAGHGWACGRNGLLLRFNG